MESLFKLATLWSLLNLVDAQPLQGWKMSSNKEGLTFSAVVQVNNLQQRSMFRIPEELKNCSQLSAEMSRWCLLATLELLLGLSRPMTSTEV